MPLYELVLKWDDEQEVRLTDKPLTVGKVLKLHGLDWKVTQEVPPTTSDIDRRYLAQRVNANPS